MFSIHSEHYTVLLSGFTLLAYVNIVSASGGNFLGNISSMKSASDGKYGAGL